MAPREASAQCVDDELKQELVGGRHYRGVEERLFTKAFRHELSVMGGLYAADLYSSSWLVGRRVHLPLQRGPRPRGERAVHALPQRRDRLVRAALPGDPGASTTRTSPGRLYFGHLVWSFAYGKLRWMGDGISRFDFNLAIGAGATDDSTSLGVTGSAGLGTKFYFGKWFAVRFDVRDHVLQEVLVGDEHLVNDVLVTLGASVFIPFGG